MSEKELVKGVSEDLVAKLKEVQSDILMLKEAGIDISSLSDGYHSFGELYDYRMVYNSLVANMIVEGKDLPHAFANKSYMHSDGKLCFGGGWFVVNIRTPDGWVSNHYKAFYWDLFKIPQVMYAPDWDGHTPEQAYERLRKFALSFEYGKL